MKKERGITLIALVITIIVLLILAGVSISLVVGDNGVLTQATNAVETNRKASAKEDVEMAWAGATSKYWEDWANNSDSVADLDFYQGELENKETSGGIINSIEEGEDEGTYKVLYKANDQDKSYKFIIDPNGKANIILGNADEIAADNSNIGKYVNYELPNSNLEWQILYANSKNVYIITVGTFSSYNMSSDLENYNGTSDFSDLTRFPAVGDGNLYMIYKNGNLLYNSGSNINMKAAECLLDSENPKWSGLSNNYAKWVIGGPTAELLVESYNATVSNEDAKVTIGPLNANGYPKTLTNTHMPVDDTKPWNHHSNYWLACPAGNTNDTNSLRYFSWVEIFSSNSPSYPYALRPVVCLKSETVLTFNTESQKFDLSMDD